MARLILKRNDVKLVHGDPTISPAGALAHNPAVIQRWDSVALAPRALLAPRINKGRKGNEGGNFFFQVKESDIPERGDGETKLKRNDVKLVHDDPTISPAGA